MKIIFKIIIFSLFLSSFTLIAPQKAAAQVSIDFQVFYDDLSPYGDWVENDDYGYVWLPNVSSNFTPYGTNGYWVYTYAGWTWVSNYSWGWAPFHYGRWYYDSYYGWEWAPDNEWGPGWVTWRRSEGYYGWAPIGPGISINIAYSNSYNLPYNQWTFVRDRDFGRTNINNYYISSSNYTTIINNSTVINNIQVDNSSNVRYNSGPDRTEVQRQTGTTFTPVTMKDKSGPGQNLSNGELQMYRPRVESNNTNGKRSAPAKVTSLKEVKPAGQRNIQSQSQKADQPIRNQVNEQPTKLQQQIEQQSKQQPVQQQRNEQSTKQQQKIEQQSKQQPAQQQRNDQPVKEKPVQKQQNEQPATQQQRVEQQSKQQPQQQRNDQPVKEQPPQQQKNEQPAKQRNDDPSPNQKPLQPQQNEQPTKQQQRNDQPVKQQPDNKPIKEQQAQPAKNDQPVKQQAPQKKNNN